MTQQPDMPLAASLAVLSAYAGIDLQTAEGVKLQDRKDTKYILHAQRLPELLAELAKEYVVLEVEGKRAQRYKSVYFDTPSRDAYLAHHNGRLNRTKIRIRDYVESGLTFLEFKMKDNHYRTVKSRKRIAFETRQIPLEEQALLAQRFDWGEESLEPILEVGFFRIMLAHLERGERVTIDLGLDFRSLDQAAATRLDRVCVVEVKRLRSGGATPMQLALRSHRIYKSPMSKYCVGMALLHPELKRNRFKPLLAHIAQCDAVLPHNDDSHFDQPFPTFSR
jgi:VTC domain